MEETCAAPFQGAVTPKLSEETVKFYKDAAESTVHRKIMSVEFADAFARAQKNFKPILKTKTNPYFNSKYADLNGVLEATVPALNAEGISFSQPFIEKNGKTYVVSRMLFKGEVYEDGGLPLPTQVKPQELISYSTYYKRGLATSLFGVSADEDVDGNDAEQQKGKTPATKPSTSVQEPKKERPRTATGTKVPSTETAAQVQEPAAQSSFQATDEDVPNNISSVPDAGQRKDYIARLKELISKSSKEGVQKFIATVVGGEFTTNTLTSAQWTESLSKLEQADKEGKLKELLQ